MGHGVDGVLSFYTRTSVLVEDSQKRNKGFPKTKQKLRVHVRQQTPTPTSSS